MVPDECRCFGPDNMDDFVDSRALTQDVVLSLHDCEVDTAHLALRHLSELSLASHSVYVCLTLQQRKQRAFTPWLRDCVTVARSPGNPVLLRISGHNRHMHSSGDKRAHAASFDMRVGGMQCRALVDTGATISVMHDSFVRTLGVPVQHTSGNIEGLGGNVHVVGKVQLPVKVGVAQIMHTFTVISSTVAGYDVLLGEDFLIPNSGGLLFSPTHVRFLLSYGDKFITVSRALSSSLITTLEKSGSVFSATLDTASRTVSRREGKRMMREARRGNIVLFAVCLADVDKPAAAGAKPVLNEAIRAVIDKHSTPGGTLCGDVPKGVRTGGGAEMHIHLEPNANPVHVRQYRSVRFANELGEAVAQGGGCKKTYMRAFWTELSCALCRGLGRQYNKTEVNVLRASGDHFQMGHDVVISGHCDE